MMNRRSALKLAVGLLAPARLLMPQSGSVPDIDARIRKLAADAGMKMLFKGATAAEAREWQQRFSTQLRSLLGPFDPPAEWRTEVEKTVEFDDHTREHLVLHAAPHPSLPVYRLTPKGGGAKTRAGVVAVHGHGAHGYDAVAGIADTPEGQEDIRKISYDYGLQLVRRGYVVTVPCLTPFGRRLDSRDSYGGDDPCAVTHVRLGLLGKLLIAENLRDVLWSRELLSKTPGVDAGRTACVGLSYGGRMTMLAAAMEPKFRMAVIAGALNLMQERISVRYSCGAQVIPGLLQYGDVPEIGALIAPRPCLWTAGNQDALMVKEWIEPAMERIRRVYRAQGAEGQLQLQRFEGGHEWSGTVAHPLLDRVLES